MCPINRLYLKDEQIQTDPLQTADSRPRGWHLAITIFPKPPFLYKREELTKNNKTRHINQAGHASKQRFVHKSKKFDLNIFGFE